MKFLALAALVAVASAEACTEDELVDDVNCDVTTTDDAGEETVTCTEVVADETECDADDEEDAEEEASSALFAGVASAAVAATMMF